MPEQRIEEVRVGHLEAPKPLEFSPSIRPSEDALQKRVGLALRDAGPLLAEREQQLAADTEKWNQINSDLVGLRGSRAEAAIQQLRELGKTPGLAHGPDGFGPSDGHFQIENGLITIGNLKYAAPTETIACTQAAFRAVAAAYWDWTGLGHGTLGSEFSINEKLRQAFDKWLVNTNDLSGAIGAANLLGFGYPLKNFQDIRRGDLIQFYWPDAANPNAGHLGLVTRVDRDASGNIASIQLLSATNEGGVRPPIKATVIRNLDKYSENGLGQDNKFPGYKMYAGRLYEKLPTTENYDYEMSLQRQADELGRNSIQPSLQALDRVRTLEHIVNDKHLSQMSEGLPRRLVDELTSKKEFSLRELQPELNQLQAFVKNKDIWSAFQARLKQGHLDSGSRSELERDVLSKLFGGSAVTYIERGLNASQNLNSLEELRGIVEDSAARLALITAEKSLWNLGERIQAKDEYDGLRRNLALAELMVRAEERHNFQLALDALSQAVAANGTLVVNKRLQDLLDRIKAKSVPETSELAVWFRAILARVGAAPL